MGRKNIFPKRLELNNKCIQNYMEEREVKQAVYNNQKFQWMEQIVL